MKLKNGNAANIAREFLCNFLCVRGKIKTLCKQAREIHYKKKSNQSKAARLIRKSSSRLSNGAEVACDYHERFGGTLKFNDRQNGLRRCQSERRG